MSHLGIRFVSTAAAAPLLLLGLAVTPENSPAQAQPSSLIITMRAMQSPLAPTQCTAIEVVVTDASGRAPLRPDGKQVSGWDVDLSLASPAPDAFAWGDERHRFLCARAPTAPYAVVSAHYPAQFLAPAERLENVQADQSIQVLMQMAGAPAAGYGQQQAVGAPNGYAQQPAGSSPAAGYAPQPAVAPGQPYTPQTNPGTGQPDYTQPGNQQYAPPQPGTPQQASGAPTQQASAPPTNPAAGPAAAGVTTPAGQPTTYAAAGVTPMPIPTAAPAAGQPAEKGGGGFFKKLGKHLKEKANEVTNQTAENLTSSANQMVDATAQTGSNLVSGAAAQATSVAQSTVGGISSSLVPSSLRAAANADNLSVAVASGEAVLRMMRFIGNTDVLDATGRELVKRLAAVLNATPGNYVIQAHVDPLPAPAEPGATQVLSEHRAAAVKAALISNGVAAGRLIALGYGTAQPLPEVPPEGGPPSSARVVIARTQ
jgi:outer membrane protein OmpA-like peptidoglycan-associated protein